MNKHSVFRFYSEQTWSSLDSKKVTNKILDIDKTNINEMAVLLMRFLDRGVNDIIVPRGYPFMEESVLEEQKITPM